MFFKKMNQYTQYYVNQAGSGLPGFQGIRYQKGHGFFGRLFSNTLLPFIKRLLPALGKRALPSAIGLAQDIMSGENVGRSTLNRLGDIGKNVADETLDQLKTRIQKGSGRKRKCRKQSTSRVTTRRKRRKSYKNRLGRKKSRLNFL
jgi:hypothetical protein